MSAKARRSRASMVRYETPGVWCKVGGVVDDIPGPIPGPHRPAIGGI